jgi:hypothetical protein
MFGGRSDMCAFHGHFPLNRKQNRHFDGGGVDAYLLVLFIQDAGFDRIQSL